MLVYYKENKICDSCWVSVKLPVSMLITLKILHKSIQSYKFYQKWQPGKCSLNITCSAKLANYLLYFLLHSFNFAKNANIKKKLQHACFWVLCKLTTHSAITRMLEQCIKTSFQIGRALVLLSRNYHFNMYSYAIIKIKRFWTQVWYMQKHCFFVLIEHFQLVWYKKII